MIKLTKLILNNSSSYQFESNSTKFPVQRDSTLYRKESTDQSLCLCAQEGSFVACMTKTTESTNWRMACCAAGGDVWVQAFWKDPADVKYQMLFLCMQDDTKKMWKENQSNVLKHIWRRENVSIVCLFIIIDNNITLEKIFTIYFLHWINFQHYIVS